MSRYTDLGLQIGELLDHKRTCYGDTFGTVPKILELLYPKGITTAQYPDVLTVVRMLDKLCRIATGNPEDQEDSWQDLAGYSVLMMARRAENGTR